MTVDISISASPKLHLLKTTCFASFATKFILVSLVFIAQTAPGLTTILLSLNVDIALSKKRISVLLEYFTFPSLSLQTSLCCITLQVTDLCQVFATCLAR